MILRSLRALCALLLVASTCACSYPATEVLVVIGTDVDPAVPLTITAFARVGLVDSGAASTQTWIRDPLDGGHIDGGIQLPASFAIVPREAPHDEAVSLDIEANAGGVLLRRRTSFRFVPSQTLVLRVFLSSRCAAPAVGCSSPGACTVQRLCEDTGETCGGDGSCVAVQVTLGTDRDGSFGDIPALPACGAYHQGCCNVGAPCANSLSCVAGRCQRCTDAAETCCVGPTVKPDGSQCASVSDPCHLAGTCRAGVCSAVSNAPDGTQCAAAPDACHAPSQCQSGTCVLQPIADGTICGSAPDVCHLAPTCASGVCSVPADAPDGTMCGAAPDVCHLAPTCASGVCSAPADAPNGTMCGAAPNACHRPNACNAGVCTPQPLPNGTVCAPTANPCLRNGTCTGGVCGAISNAPNGTVCAPTGNPCQTPGTCTAGACGAIGTRADGTPWGAGGINRCCGGNPVQVNSNANCGVCGLTCRAGNCTLYGGTGYYYCPCSANSQCFSACCRTFVPGNNLCVPGVCANGSCSTNNCPNGGLCIQGSGQPNGCTY